MQVSQSCPYYKCDIYWQLSHLGYSSQLENYRLVGNNMLIPERNRCASRNCLITCQVGVHLFLSIDHFRRQLQGYVF